MSVDQVLGPLRDIAVASVGAVVVAYLGVRTWRKQLRGTADWELARRLLRSVYALRDALTASRSPFMSSGEMAAARDAVARERSAAGRPVGEIDDEAAAYQMRWDRVMKAVSDFQVERLEAEVLWGEPARGVLAPIEKVAIELNTAITMYLRLKRMEPMRDETARLLQKQEEIIWPGMGDDGKDEYAEKLSAAVRAAEGLVRPHLAR